MKTKRPLILIHLSLLHFFVDFLSVAPLFYAMRTGPIQAPSSLFIFFLLYNCCAFLLQPLFGYLADRFRFEKEDSSFRYDMMVSFGLLLVGFLISAFGVFYSARAEIALGIGSVVSGIANAMFHSFAGKVVLTRSNRASPGGLFVSTGALGVGLAGGALLEMNHVVVAFLFIAPLALILYAILFACGKIRVGEEAEVVPCKLDNGGKLAFLVLILLLAIGVRSFLGFVKMEGEAPSGWGLVFLCSVMVFLGKGVGGILLDWLGPYVTIALSTVSAILFSSFFGPLWTQYFFAFSFNLLMPLTLDGLRRCFPGQEGFAFGLSAAFLIPGWLIGEVVNQTGMMDFVVPLMVGLTGVLLLLAYFLKRQKGESWRAL